MALVEEKVKDLILEKKKIAKKITLQNESHLRIIGDLEARIEMLNEDIYNNCKHHWIYEQAAYQERSRRYCEVCGCYK